ncbi:hypothetical protein OMAG_001158 [Candidatus Omnitrophus magneticus]|uniref:Uncharacterized protein n=1 Tax=Candidatus Omnitrophus magneticus TaxID=1609969 RepID=A0A0F0CNM1_9BACT|nr:hypothetical protein OMAG_001158 [Candidatus Omnitrophus magneticus]
MEGEDVEDNLEYFVDYEDSAAAADDDDDDDDDDDECNCSV